MYPEFSVPGVKPEDTWQLFNVSNFAYYVNKVRDLQNGVCPFCVIDPSVNTVLYENDSWRLWQNTMAPRTGQECQLIIPAKRHISRLSELMMVELADLYLALEWARNKLGVSDDGVLLVRTGDPARNAKSVPHLHFNFQYPTGKDRVEVTIAKSETDLFKKLPILQAWEKVRLAQEQGIEDPILVLTAEEWALVKDKMSPAPTAQ